MAQEFDCDAYLARVGYAGPHAPTLDVLARLIACHTAAVTFENIDPIARRVPALDLGSLQQKLVTQRRGGYCYEQNTLFQAALRALGFQVTGLLARVRRGLPPEMMTPRSHMLLKVDLPDGPYLADVGFGGQTPTAPLQLRADIEQPTPNETFRLRAIGEEYMLQAEVGGEWYDIYLLALLPQLPEDYVMVNWHTATRPNAQFVENLMVSRPTPGVRRGLFNRVFTLRRAEASPEHRVLRTREDYAEVLTEHFHLAPDDDAMAAVMTVMQKHDPDQRHRRSFV